jgi:large subunit ribosomal protein L14
MIQQQTILWVSDNSGAKTVKCIKVLDGFKRQYAILGDIIIVSVQELRNYSKEISKVKTKEIYRALIIRTKMYYGSRDGSSFLLKHNWVVLVNKQGSPIGTRILGPVPKILKYRKLQKVMSISSGLF